MPIKSVVLALGVFAATQPCYAAADYNSQPYEFVSDFIHTLGALEKIRAEAEADMKSGENSFEGCIRSTEAFQLELNGDIASLNGIHLTEKMSGVPNQFAQFFSYKRDLYRKLQDNCSAMLSGPKPGVDYGALATNTPKITAQMEYLDESLFKGSPLVFATLVSDKPDAQGHMSHLSISKEQRDSLARTIKLEFGKKLDAENQNYLVSAASTIYFYLAKKGFKGSDEP
jgi:hypothetical protein